MPTAILVDGSFFLRRVRHAFPDHDHTDPVQVAQSLELLALWHLVLRVGTIQVELDKANSKPLVESRDFYRLFFYDCPPLRKRMHRPVSGDAIDFAKTPEALFRDKLHQEIAKLRKVALRLGRLSDTSAWRLTERATDRLRSEGAAFVPSDADFEIDTKQKGVDMRLGIDVASLAFKKQVDQIIIVAADADFVPAAKLARREGIDVILDRMGDRRTAIDLIDQVDGVRDCHMPKPTS